MSGLNLYRCRWTETADPLMPLLATTAREAALMYAQINYVICRDNPSKHDTLFVAVHDADSAPLYHFEIAVEHKPTFTALECYKPTEPETLEAITAKEAA